jgi:hypothetical protein
MQMPQHRRFGQTDSVLLELSYAALRQLKQLPHRHSAHNQGKMTVSKLKKWTRNRNGACRQG